MRKVKTKPKNKAVLSYLALLQADILQGYGYRHDRCYLCTELPTHAFRYKGGEDYHVGKLVGACNVHSRNFSEKAHSYLDDPHWNLDWEKVL